MKNTRRISLPKNTQTVTFVLDFSGSMDILAEKLNTSFRNEIEALRKNSATHNIPTRVSVYVFGSSVQCMVKNADISSKVLDKITYSNMGMTALYDAIGAAIDEYVPPVASNDAHLILVLTDGEENVSRKYKSCIGRTIMDAVKTGTVTVTVRCPASIRNTLIAAGISADNLAVWDGTAEQLQEVEEKTSGGISTYYKSRSLGKTAVSNFYSPNTSFSPTTLKRTVEDVTHKFVQCAIPNTWDGRQIRDFVEQDLGKSYVKGNAFYELSKKETVQAQKSIAIREVSTGKIYSDDDARDLLGLPSGVEIKVIPSSYNGKYTIYIQSSSVNRKLVGGTKLLYKVV